MELKVSHRQLCLAVFVSSKLKVIFRIFILDVNFRGPAIHYARSSLKLAPG